MKSLEQARQEYRDVLKTMVGSALVAVGGARSMAIKSTALRCGA